MNTYKNTAIYKGISLFLKTIIFIFSLTYIIYKIDFTNLKSIFSNPSIKITYLLIAILLVFINWGLEAYKWKILIYKLEEISYKKAFQAVLSGVTIGIFTPNRVGEFAGRIFYLDYKNKSNNYKVQAALISAIGSFMQFTVTLIVGAIAIIYLIKQDNLIAIEAKNIFTNVYFLLIISLILVLITIIFIFKNHITNKFKNYVEYVFTYSIKQIVAVFLVSLIRYFIFSLQYVLILKSFHVELSSILCFNLIAATFFISTVIPTFALTEISVRGMSAVFFFGFYLQDTSVVLTASVFLWIINLAFPAIIGSIFIWRLKFFKE